MDPGREILFGIHPVAEALRAARRKIDTLYISAKAPTKRISKIAANARQTGVAVETRPAAELSRLTGAANHQGIVARVSRFPFCSLSDLPRATAGRAPLLLLLDRIQDPQNLGALVRTAVGAGVDGIVIPKKHAAMPTPTVSRASAGALEHTQVACVTNLANTIEKLKSGGLWVAGLDRSGAASVFDTDLSGPLALVVGGEENGIRPLVKQKCDYLLHIPQMGRLDCLNASAAGAVVMYETFRQRLAD